jgi:hypothetical protein
MAKKIIILIGIFFLVFLFFVGFHLYNIYSRVSRCGVENCHGLDIKCGPNIPEACTMEYQLGDGCRQYAKCEIIKGKCQLVENFKFKQCKSCVENCIEKFKEDSQKQSECEKNCYY